MVAQLGELEDGGQATNTPLSLEKLFEVVTCGMQGEDKENTWHDSSKFAVTSPDSP